MFRRILDFLLHALPEGDVKDQQMWVNFLLLAATLTTVQAGIIRGTITEAQTGNSLASSLVTLQPLGAASATSTRTDDSGNFEFGPLAAGAYIVRASRRGFLALEYGQRQWNSAGTPVTVTSDDAVFLNFRLHRPGSITGVIRDENDVGMGNHEVLAYRKAEPPELVARAKSDERGVYRLSGLEPGIYLIRTTGNASSDVSYIPTFAKQAIGIDDAQQVRVYLDEDSRGIDVRPREGKLFRVTGELMVPDGYSVTVTLASDLGRRTSNSATFDFSGLPPGPYEIYAEARDKEGNLHKGAWSQFTLARDIPNYTLTGADVRDTQFDITPRSMARSVSVSVIARRKDLAGTGEPQLLKLEDNRTLLPPGRWEMIAIPPDGSYISQFSGNGRGKQRPDGWNEVTVQYFTMVRIGISSSGSSVHGMVKAGGTPVEGAPVFLEAWDPESLKRVAELRSTRSDAAGRYTFNGLPPGTYRLLSSFEYLAPDSAAIDLALPYSLKVDSHTDLAIDPELYGLP